jgi:RND family efflux transporter MFP subunit
MKHKQAMIRQAEAEADQADKALAAARANVAVVEAGTIEAMASNDYWDSQWKKMVGLAKSGVVDQQTREETLKQFQAAGGRLTSAKAMVDKAKADRDKAEADVRAAAARIDVAKADTARAEAMLSYAKIRAPYDGVVTLRNVNTGNFVQPASGKGDWLFTVARLDPVRIVIAVPEADAELIQDNSEVSVAAPAFPGPSLRGNVARTSWALLESGGRTLRTEIDLPNKDGRLRPGTYVYAQVIRQLPETWTLPVSAVVKQGDALVCFLIDGDKAVRTPVQIGRSDGSFVEVLKLQKPGTPWVEWTGQEKVATRAGSLTDGQAVQVGAGK